MKLSLETVFLPLLPPCLTWGVVSNYTSSPDLRLEMCPCDFNILYGSFTPFSLAWRALGKEIVRGQEQKMHVKERRSCLVMDFFLLLLQQVVFKQRSPLSSAFLPELCILCFPSSCGEEGHGWTWLDTPWVLLVAEAGQL